MSEPLIDIRPDHWAIVADILRRHVPDREVWAFGSRATWNAKEYSDLDLAVIAETPLSLSVSAVLTDDFAESDLPFKVDVVDWATTSESFRTIIERDKAVVQAGSRSSAMAVSDWAPIRLGDVCRKIGSGATPRGGSDVYLQCGPYALIRSQNVYNDGFHRDGLAYIGEKHAAELDNVEVFTGDVLLNITGDSVARACQVDPGVLPARVNQHVAIVRPDPDKLDPRFLRYFLVSPEMQTKLLSWAGSGGTRNALTKGMIESFDVLAPEDITEQRAIAHILGTLDDKVELNRRMNETLEAMARALFKSWFVDFDPVRAKMERRDPRLPKPIADLFPASLVESELGEIPEGWRLWSFSDVCDTIFSGGTPSTTRPDYWGGGIPWLSSGETRSKFIVATEKTITSKGVTNSSTRLARAGATVIASAGQGYTRGQTSMLMFDSYINQSVVVLQADPRYTSNAHLFFDLERRYEQFRQVSDAHSSRGSLTTKLLADLRVVVPTRTVIEAFDKIAVPVVLKIAGALGESRILAALRDTLLSKLISGELRVAKWQRRIDAASLVDNHEHL